MAKSLTFEYDKVGDILSVTIDGVCPYPAQESDYLGEDDVVVSFNPDTGEVERLEILFFNARMQKEGRLDLDLTPDAEIASAESPGAEARVSAD
jgi:hypothetical protein